MAGHARTIGVLTPRCEEEEEEEEEEEDISASESRNCLLHLLSLVF